MHAQTRQSTCECALALCTSMIALLPLRVNKACFHSTVNPSQRHDGQLHLDQPYASQPPRHLVDLLQEKMRERERKRGGGRRGEGKGERAREGGEGAERPRKTERDRELENERARAFASRAWQVTGASPTSAPASASPPVDAPAYLTIETAQGKQAPHSRPKHTRMRTRIHAHTCTRGCARKECADA
eukprot:1488551-Pleurochrysis_carterae.AAC.4